MTGDHESPAVASPELLAVATHLADALHAHRRRSEANGVTVPDLLVVLEELARYRVRKGLERSTFARSDVAVDDPDVPVQLLTYKQTATALSTSMSTVKRLVTAGELRTVHVGRAARIRTTDLDAYVAQLNPAEPPRRTG